MTSKQNKRLLPQVEKMLGAASARKIERAGESTKQSRKYRRSRQTLVVLLASLALTGTALATVTGWNPLAGGTTHQCNTFTAESHDGVTLYRITVLNSTGLTCKRATGVIEAFWGPEQAVTRHGRFTYNSFYTIDGFPEWRCQESAGAGLCRLRDGRVAEYEVQRVWERPPPAVGRAGGARKPEAGSSPALVSPRGVGALRSGVNAEALQRRHLIGRLTPSCELHHGERGARLRPPLTGFALFLDPGMRLSGLVIQGGAETSRHIGIGSTVKEARKAYPHAVYDPPGSLEPFAEGFLWVGNRWHPKMSFTIDAKSREISEIAVGSVYFCE
jgi:hypothetical protein